MKREAVIAICRTVVACLLLTFIFAVTTAQKKVNYCEPSPDLKEELKKISAVSEEGLPYKQAREQQSTMLQELSKKYPGDFHLRKRMQNDRLYALNRDWDALLAEYQAHMEKNQGDVESVYFFSRLLVGRRTKEAITHLEKLTQQSPGFPWSYRELAQLYNYPNFRDAVKSKENLKKWMALCPSSMDGFSLLSRVGDAAMMNEAAKSLRKRLEVSKGSEDQADWDNLWTLEFKIKPVPEHAQVRLQISEDLKRLREQRFNTKEWLTILHAGYKTLGDKEGRKWVESEALRLFPKWRTTGNMVRDRWREEHPYPKSEDSPEKKQAYYQASLKAADEWIKLWPDDWNAWSSRFNALSALENSTGKEIEVAGESYLRAMDVNEGYVYMIPPATVLVAQTYMKHNVAIDRIPLLVLKGLDEVERRSKRDVVSDLYPREEGDEDGNLKYVRWRGWPLLAEASAKLKQPDKARDVLNRMSELLKKEKPGEKATQKQELSYANNQATFWQTTGKVAEAENRKLDALTAYQTALSFRPKSAEPKPDRKDELSENTRRLWKELGGTDEGLQAYLARNDSTKSAVASAEAVTWDTKAQQLPDFTLSDLQGKKWQLADLKGKVSFINLWATWCGPCKAELPYVQKLHEEMKENKDVLVLTLNIDEELGLVEPFVKENKYSFTVIPAQAYAEGLGVFSIPRNWIIGADGVMQLEGIGFGREGDEWMKKVKEMIQKARGGK
jgi:thiol-disulfide isomerase/thioredoxin